MSSEKLIANELLAFIQHAIDTMDEVSIMQICKSSFKEEEICSSKVLLYQTLGQADRMPTRRRDEKGERSLQDIINLLKSTDPDDVPAFVAKELHKLPPVTFDHVDVTRLLKDITALKTSLAESEIFNISDGFLRAEALADIGKHQSSPQPGPSLQQLKHDVAYHHGLGGGPHGSRPHQMGHHGGLDGIELFDPVTSTPMPALGSMGEAPPPHHQLHHYGGMVNPHHHAGALGHGPPTHLTHHPAGALHADTDTDPRELEAFAERFKQRRIKLGVTQADVGKALANLKLPGVGALSQSTICRFESLTLSHNNMIALKPILQAWLEEAEAQAKNKRRDPDAPSVLPAGEKKRKRTSIAAPEKRSLEAYFAVQPRPSGEKIAAIAEKLDLKKNVVRVWFCNQRQKQKRMKFAAQH